MDFNNQYFKILNKINNNKNNKNKVKIPNIINENNNQTYTNEEELHDNQNLKFNNSFNQNYGYYLGNTKPGVIYPNSVNSYQILRNVYLRNPQATNPNINSSNNDISTTQFVNQTINKPLNYIDINVSSYNIQYNSNYIVGLYFIVTCEKSDIYLPSNCPLGTNIIIINNNTLNTISNVNIYTTNGDIIINTVSRLTHPIRGSSALNIQSCYVCNLIYFIQPNKNIWRTVVY